MTDSETGDVLVGRTVNLFLDGNNLAGKTDENGIAQITAGSLVKGTYSVTLKFSGTISRYAATTVYQNVFVDGFVPANITVVSAISNNVNSIFNVRLTDSENGKAISGRTVNLIFDGKNLAGKTDENGIAKITAKPLVKGTYTVTLKFSGTISHYAPTTVTQKAAVDGFVPVKMTVVSADANNAATLFQVKLTDSENGNVLAGRTVNLIFDGNNLAGKTDANGIAKITAKPLVKGTYTVTLKFSGTISYYAATTVNQKVPVNGFVPAKMTIVHAVSDDSNTLFEVKLTDSENGNVLSGRTINLIVNGKNLAAKTDANGIAKMTTKSLQGTYTVTLKFAGTASHYAPTTVTQKVSIFKKIPVKMTVLSADVKSDSTIFKVKLTDSQNGNVISGRTVNLVVSGKNLAGVTDKNGIAQITTKPLEKGVYDITLKFSGTAYYYAATSVSQKVGVGVTPISLNSLIAASKNVKNYIENNGELPATVTIDGIAYTTPQYLYLASEAVYHLKSGDKSYLYSKQVDAPNSPVTASNLGNLYDYYSVARRVVNQGNTYNAMPRYAISDVGNIGYDGLVYAFSRVLTYYGEHSSMPNYVAIKSLATAFDSNANSKNSISNLAAYLAASKNCQVDNAQIQALAEKLTSGLTSDTAKATAIYNYVRDAISYSYYYDTKYGAVGTLNAKNGNCVDQSHLLVALYRAADLPARYVHGTCYFSLSGNTYGHVWTQVLIGDTWVVGDPTSTRNSFGSVVNWNTNSYTLHGYYASLPF